MKYFIDQEFLEGFRKPFLGKSRHFIDLISIGIVSDDGRELYLISNEFDFDRVWKDDWLRDNVLLPLVYELAKQDYKERGAFCVNWPVKEWLELIKQGRRWKKIWHKRSKQLIKKYGKSNSVIKHEILLFFGYDVAWTDFGSQIVTKQWPFEIYGYYADYDWVLFCSLFGRMIDLPTGFPMYCRDLKQMIDEKAASLNRGNVSERLFEGVQNHTAQVDNNLMNATDPFQTHFTNIDQWSFDQKLAFIKKHIDYPTQTDEHHALADARWNKELYNFILSI